MADVKAQVRSSQRASTITHFLASLRALPAMSLAHLGKAHIDSSPLNGTWTLHSGRRCGCKSLYWKRRSRICATAIHARWTLCSAQEGRPLEVISHRSTCLHCVAHLPAKLGSSGLLRDDTATTADACRGQLARQPYTCRAAALLQCDLAVSGTGRSACITFGGAGL